MSRYRPVVDLERANASCRSEPSNRCSPPRADAPMTQRSPTVPRSNSKSREWLLGTIGHGYLGPAQNPCPRTDGLPTVGGKPCLSTTGSAGRNPSSRVSGTSAFAGVPGPSPAGCGSSVGVACCPVGFSWLAPAAVSRRSSLFSTGRSESSDEHVDDSDSEGDVTPRQPGSHEPRVAAAVRRGSSSHRYSA